MIGLSDYMILMKEAGMSGFNVKQFLHENETWKRLLEFLQAENVYLKTRLAQITKDDYSNGLLEQIEHYHNILISEDNTIGMLRHDVADQDKGLRKSDTENSDFLKELGKRQKKLRKEIEIAEQKFNKLKFEFNNFFSENLYG